MIGLIACVVAPKNFLSTLIAPVRGLSAYTVAKRLPELTGYCISLQDIVGCGCIQVSPELSRQADLDSLGQTIDEGRKCGLETVYGEVESFEAQEAPSDNYLRGHVTNILIRARLNSFNDF